MYTDDVIDDADESDSSSSSKQVIGGEERKVEQEKEKEKKVFWDKESNEKAAKSVNEEDNYKWEDEVSGPFLSSPSSYQFQSLSLFSVVQTPLFMFLLGPNKSSACMSFLLLCLSLLLSLSPIHFEIGCSILFYSCCLERLSP